MIEILVDITTLGPRGDGYQYIFMILNIHLDANAVTDISTFL